MARRLINTRVGEYKTSFVCTLLYAFAVIFGIFSIFYFKISLVGQDNLSNNYESFSPIGFFMNEKFDSNNIYSYLSIAYIVYFVFLFFNLFICMSIGQLSKRGYYKYSKLFEIVLGLACIGFSAYCLTTHYINKDMYLNFLIYEGIVGLIIFASILVYFNSKKISIYD